MSSDVTLKAPLTSQHPPEGPPLPSDAFPLPRGRPFLSAAPRARYGGGGGARAAPGGLGGPGGGGPGLGTGSWRTERGGGAPREGSGRAGSAAWAPPQGLVGLGMSRASLPTGTSGRDAERRRGVRGSLRASQVVSGTHSSEQPAAWIRKPLACCVRWKNTNFCSRFCISILRKYVKGKVNLERTLAWCG